MSPTCVLVRVRAEQFDHVAVTHQAESFNASPSSWTGETLDGLVRVAASEPGERWLEVACGPGIISRALAPHVREVHGVDLTPAMVAIARREAATAGAGNATFAVGDATALGLPTASFDGAIARYTLHHVPAPSRVFGELARVVRPGGHVVLADHVVDTEAQAAAWSLEIERLRDPSHWACLPVDRLRALGEQAGLRLEHDELVPLVLDFDDWLGRGSGGPAAHAVIEHLLAARPGRPECFSVYERDGRRVLELRVWLSRWER